MALLINKAFPGLPKLEPVDRNNYKCWYQKFLIFFEQLEVNYVVFSDLTKENNLTERSDASLNRIDIDKSTTVDESTIKKFKKDNKTVKGIY